MKIIYMHHAERNISEYHNDPDKRQVEDITEKGIQEAQLIAEKLKGTKVTAIYTSPYIRCLHTAEIVNSHLQAPIYKEERFNEKKKDEEWKDLLTRNMEAIDDIVNKYNEDDTIICVTSGVNVSAFICYFYNIPVSNEVPWSQGANCSLINFYTNSNVD